MKKVLLFILLILHLALSHGQQTTIDSIKQLMPSNNDTLTLVWSSLLGQEYGHVHTDSAKHYNKQYLALCKKLNLALQEADALFQNAFEAAMDNNAAESINMLITAQSILERPANTR